MLVAFAVTAVRASAAHCLPSAAVLCKLSQTFIIEAENFRRFSMSFQDIYSVIKAESGVYKYYCNGQWLESSSGKSVPVINPTTNEKDYAVQGKLQRLGRVKQSSMALLQQQPFSCAAASATGMSSAINLCLRNVLHLLWQCMLP